ncbi:hypothetical protein JMF89_18605, partial [Clostridiaceae bacterium UIB06]|nr:hypothetical protein [Clostridiaceae bacterium UIB06]
EGSVVFLEGKYRIGFQNVKEELIEYVRVGRMRQGFFGEILSHFFMVK